MDTHETLVPSRNDPPQRGQRLSVMFMGLLARRDEDRRIEENRHSLALQDGVDSFFACAIHDPIPIRTRFRNTLMDPQAVDFDH